MRRAADSDIRLDARFVVGAMADSKNINLFSGTDTTKTRLVKSEIHRTGIFEIALDAEAQGKSCCLLEGCNL